MKKKIEIELDEKDLTLSQELGFRILVESLPNVMIDKCFLHPKKIVVDGNTAWQREK